MKKSMILRSLLISCVLLSFTLMSVAPAYTQANPTATPLPTLTSIPPVPKPEGAIEITFWYGLGGLLGNVVQETVNRYNLSQSKYYVKAIFQSSYEDTINKINAGLSSGDLPNVAQVYEAGLQRMIDTKQIIPMQDLAERDGLMSIIEDLEPIVRASYTVDGKIYSMPFNTSTAVWYINRKAFVEAGLDPAKKIWTYDEMLDAARKLTKKDANGKTTQYGYALRTDAWQFEQCFVMANEFYGDPMNGRAGRMEKYTFNREHGVKCLDFYQTLNKEGLAQYFGTGDASGCYLRGECAMVMSSIAGLRTFLATIDRLGSGVELDIVQIPRFPGNEGVSALGGASLWISKTGTPEQQEGAWDFVKWTAQPEVQAWWALNTGYYPVVKKAYEMQDMKDALSRYPMFQVAIDQVRAHTNIPANTVHVSGVFVSMRTDLLKAMDDYFSGKIATAQEALDQAAAAANEKLSDYNDSVQ
jgi:sn-glycerol 3-phosphate transport system substrate-binding protein